MITEDGAAKIMDFVASPIKAKSANGLTKTSAASGTPPYMAPEQTLGSVSKAADLLRAGRDGL